MGSPSTMWSTEVDQVYDSDYEAGKGLRYEHDRVYRWVKMNHASLLSAVAGDMVSFNAAPDGTNTTPGVYFSTAGVAAGLLQIAAPAINTYGWVQCGGPATINQALEGSPATGDALTKQGATNGALTKRATADENIDAVSLNTAAKLILLKCSGN